MIRVRAATKDDAAMLVPLLRQADRLEMERGMGNAYDALHLSIERSELCRVANLPDGRDAEELVMQREFADAPALLVITGNLAAALARHGSHGHRLLLTRAGAAGHAAWLAALRLAGVCRRWR